MNVPLLNFFQNVSQFLSNPEFVSIWNVFWPAIFLHFRMVCEGKGGFVDVPLTAGRATGTYRDLGTTNVFPMQ